MTVHINVPESVNHPLFNCPTVRDLWVESGCEKLAGCEAQTDFKTLFESWKAVDGKKQQLGAALLWCIWNRRNDKVFNGKEIPHGIVLDRVRCLVENCCKYSSRIYGTNSSPGTPSSKTWQPPPPGFVKVNCDASLCEQGWIGLGAVARDSKGAVLFAGTRRVRGCWPPEIAECKAVLFAVKLAKKYGVEKVILEGDCQVVISTLTKISTYFTDLD